jgi:ABC-type glycerol-3-phosphate transport system substrate-binding protein
MRFIKKMAAVFMIAVVLCGTLSFMGCVDNNGPKIDTTRSQVYVGNYNGGYGERWLDELIMRFEYAYKDEVFEEGKKGVQVIAEHDKGIFHGKQLADSTRASTFDVFFTEAAVFHTFFANNNLLEITDIVAEQTLPGETKTIEDKMSDTLKQYMSRDGKYYAVPHYQAYRGIIYDYDLFNQKKLFISKTGTYVSASGDLSAGPDGDYSTLYDNGLPATYEEFFALCDYMKNSHSITPLSWAGEVRSTYTEFLLDSLYVDYDRQGYNIRKGEGQSANIVTGFDPSSQPIIEKKQVSLELGNLNELKQQAGKYYALDFLNKIVKGNYYSPASIISTQKHVMAQADFLYSRFEKNVSPIAMLVDGIWWQEEADPIFKDMETIYMDEASRTTRKFGFMPMPKVSASQAGAPMLYDGNYSLCYINGALTDPVRTRLAKLFVQFSCTDESLQKFTTITGTSRDFDYELTSEQYESMPFFSKNIYDISRNAEGICYPFVSDYSLLATLKEYSGLVGYQSTVDSNVKTSPLDTFLYDKINGVPVDAKTYFLGLKGA